MKPNKNPIQPLYKDENEHLRFKENVLVRYLLDFGGIDLNHLATIRCSREDQEQFAQLIGYSLDGFSELEYTSDKTYSVAKIAHDSELTEEQAELEYSRELIDYIKERWTTPVCYIPLLLACLSCSPDICYLKHIYMRWEVGLSTSIFLLMLAFV